MPQEFAKAGKKRVSRTKIPDGYYLIGDSNFFFNQKVQNWLGSIIDSVRKVTHIAASDANGELIGFKVPQEGVILAPQDFSIGPYAVTTEVYPDSVGTTDSQCNDAQVASIVGALDFMI